MTRVLLTGFEPFAGDATNPSWRAVSRAAELWSIQQPTTDITVATAQLPVEFGRCDAALLRAIEAEQPDLVIAVGLAGGIAEIRLERVALNIDDARIADNAGYKPIDEPVDPRGPTAFFSSLPIKAAALALAVEGIPAAISQSAGTFVCNHVFYTLMARASAQPSGQASSERFRGGFVHVPYSPDMLDAGSATPSMAVDDMARAILTVMKTSLDTSNDAHVGGGALF